eukprot:gene19025-913_t
MRRVYSQNIDGLETLAGLPADKLVECHGTFRTATCLNPECKEHYDMSKIESTIRAGKVPKKREIEASTCAHCGVVLCLEHRLPEDHKCESFTRKVGKVQKMPRKKDVVPSGDLSGVSSLATAKKAADNSRGSAIGNPNMLHDYRRVMLIVYPLSSNIKPRWFFFNKTNPMGKILDTALDRAGMENGNLSTSAGQKRYHLYHAATGSVVLPGTDAEDAVSLKYCMQSELEGFNASEAWGAGITTLLGGKEETLMLACETFIVQ